MSLPRSGVATILYPIDSAQATEQQIEVNDAVVGRRQARVVLRPVVLPHLATMIEAGSTMRRERARYARELVLGVQVPRTAQ